MASVLTEGRISPEALASLRAKIGISLRVRGNFNTSSAFDCVRHFCWGNGDGNPLFLDRDYGRGSVLGVNIAPASFLYSVCATYVHVGLPGVHRFHSGSDWRCTRPITHNHDARCIVWLDDVVERETRMGGKAAVLYFTTVFHDEDEEVLATCRSYSFAMERSAMRDRGKLNRTEVKTWTAEELAEVEASYDREVVRGATPLLWDDVAVGDAITPVTKGPLCLTDQIGWYAGCTGVPNPSHGLAYADKKKHPHWWSRNPSNGGLESPLRVHDDVTFSRSAGVPAPYDAGIQRNSWLMHMLTNWMGDGGFLVSCEAQYTAFNFFGDVTVFTGRVSRKFVEDGEHRVEIAVDGSNHRGSNISGSAVVALPSRADPMSPALRRLHSSVKLREHLATLHNAPKL